MDFILVGVDAGGTRTRAVIVADGHVIARKAAGGANPNRVGIAGTVEALTRVLVGLASTVQGRAVAGACVGLAGVSHAEARAAIARAIVASGLAVPGAPV